MQPETYRELRCFVSAGPFQELVARLTFHLSYGSNAAKKKKKMHVSRMLSRILCFTLMQH